jgi:hypothetical protein
MSAFDALRYVGSVGLAVAGLYLWGGICFLFFRFVRPETEARLLEFLNTHYDFYSSSFGRRRTAALEKAVTEEDIKRAGTRGWWMTGLPIIAFANWLNHKGSLLTPWLGVGCLFFGGLVFAYSWYGLRCLRLLGLTAYSKESSKAVTPSSLA